MDGEHGTPLLENYEKAHSLQPLRRSPRFQGNLGEVSSIPYTMSHNNINI